MPNFNVHTIAGALLAVCLLIGSTAVVQAQQDEVRISRHLDRKLKRDAARLALRLNVGEDLRFQAVQIPARDMNAIYESLVALYKGDEGVRSIFRCNVHTRPNPSIDHMLIKYDRTIDWAQPLQEGRHETTSITFNDLLYEYDLIIEKHIQWDETHDAISIRSKRPLNMASLANEFFNLEGVQDIDLGGDNELGNDISVIRTAAGWRFNFSLSFGSLAESGEKVHAWQYQISDSGEIQKISEGGDPVPDWMRCSIDTPLLAARR